MKITITDKDIIPIGTEVNPYEEIKVNTTITIDIARNDNIQKVAEEIVSALIHKTYKKTKSM